MKCFRPFVASWPAPSASGRSESGRVGISPTGLVHLSQGTHNAMAETIIGLFKTEVIHARGPWRSLDAVEYTTLEWVDWFNNRRLLEPIGHVPPAEFEAEYYRQQSGLAIAA